MKQRARTYFILADQYFETSVLLLKTLIKNGNENIGIGKSMEEAERKMLENVLVSDITLFIPTLLNCYQSMELFIKGILLLNNVEIQENHEVSNMIKQLEKIYTRQSDIYKSINSFYKHQIEIIKNFNADNKITTTKDLYEALRYPEKNKNKFSYDALKYNGDEGIMQFSIILKKMQRVKSIIIKEFNENF